MKVKIVIFIWCLFGLHFALFSQVTIREIKKNDTTVPKPVQYDSLKDYQFHDNLLDYKQYIGLELFLPPITNSKSNCLGSIEIINRYYTVLNIYTRIQIKQIFDDLHVSYSNNGKNDKMYSNTSEGQLICGIDNSDLYGGNYPDILFLIKDNITGDSIYFKPQKYTISPFILVPYFVKQKQLYDGKSVIAFNEKLPEYDWKYTFNDAATSKEIKITQNSKWICEVNLLKEEYRRFITDKSETKYTLKYILKDSLGKMIAINNLEHAQSNLSFILEDIFKEKEIEKKLKQNEIVEKRKNEENKRRNEERKEKENRKAECINKYGQRKGELIAEGKVRLGMTSEMCKTAWGECFYRNKTTIAEGIFEVWYYGWGESLHFANGILKRIEE